MRNYEHKTYAAEFKMAAIQEFQSRNISVREFVTEKGIAKVILLPMVMQDTMSLHIKESRFRGVSLI